MRTWLRLFMGDIVIYEDGKVVCSKNAHTTQHEITIAELEKNSTIRNFRTAHKWMVATCSKTEQVMQHTRTL